MPDMQIAVLIPCYDEEITIEKVITDWRHALPEATIYVYDNNSNDRTAEMALRTGATVGYEPEKGKGNVIRRMFKEIQADCYILTDGDDTYPADRASDLLQGIREGADMVIGDRLSTTYYEAVSYTHLDVYKRQLPTPWKTTDIHLRHRRKKTIHLTDGVRQAFLPAVRES